MKTSTALKHYKTKYAIAKALGITRQSVGDWGLIVPIRSAIRLEKLSNGAVKMQPELYK